MCRAEAASLPAAPASERGPQRWYCASGRKAPVGRRGAATTCTGCAPSRWAALRRPGGEGGSAAARRPDGRLGRRAGSASRDPVAHHGDAASSAERQKPWAAPPPCDRAQGLRVDAEANGAAAARGRSLWIVGEPKQRPAAGRSDRREPRPDGAWRRAAARLAVTHAGRSGERQYSDACYRREPRCEVPPCSGAAEAGGEGTGVAAQRGATNSGAGNKSWSPAARGSDRRQWPPDRAWQRATPRSPAAQAGTNGGRQHSGETAGCACARRRPAAARRRTRAAASAEAARRSAIHSEAGQKRR